MPLKFLKKVFSSSGSVKAAKGNILLIQDDSESIKGMAFYLNHMGWEVRSADSFSSGQRIINALDIDLIIAGLKVNGDNGIAFIKEIRKKPKFARIPVVFTSAASRKGESAVLRKQLPLSTITMPPYSTSSLAAAIKRSNKASTSSGKHEPVTV
jgi:DNA-binding response OmpR family regulator